ncbi:MAG: hypothetical protein RL043_1059 [Pseudomonadota bacterium]|jgi:hypothetical protein
MSDQRKATNLRLALILASVAAAFFVGMVVNHLMLSPA